MCFIECLTSDGMIDLERKIIAAMQLRKGPNIVGPFGLFQSIADAIKLLTKENIIPSIVAKKFLLIVLILNDIFYGLVT